MNLMRLRLAVCFAFVQLGTVSRSQEQETVLDLDLGEEIVVDLHGETLSSSSDQKQQQQPEEPRHDDQAQQQEQQERKQKSRDEKNNKTHDKYQEEMMAKLLQSMPTMKEAQARDVSLMLKFAKSDPDTRVLLKTIKSEKKEEKEEEKKKTKKNEGMEDNPSPKKIVEGMVQTLRDLQMSELLFKDPQKALQHMKDEGLLNEEKVKLYENDPSLLQQETRRSLYFSFVGLAVKGGYL